MPLNFTGLMGLARLNALRNTALAANGVPGIDYGSDSTPPTDTTGPFRTVSNRNINWGTRTGSPTTTGFGLGYTGGMPIGAMNSRGAVFSGFMNSRPVFRPQSTSGHYGSDYAGFHPTPFGGGFGIDAGTASSMASLSKNQL